MTHFRVGDVYIRLDIEEKIEKGSGKVPGHIRRSSGAVEMVFGAGIN